MDNLVFIGDLIKEVGNLQNVNGRIPKFEEYSLEIIEGEKFIVGTKIKKDSLYNDFSYKDGPKLLLSLINLIKEKGRLPEVWNLDELINDEDIMKWCEEYGIPYKDKVLNEKLGDGLSRGHLVHLKSFKRKIIWLYEWFSVWKDVLFEDESKIKPNKQLEMFIKLGESTKKDFSKIELIKNALAEQINLKANISVHFQFNKNTSEFEFALKASSLVDVAYFQLASLMTKSPSENKQKLSLCKMPNCNNFFWTKHGNDKFCDNPKCNPKNYWYHEKRKKNKK